MNLVLAIEPDSSQADPLSSVVRAKLGAELVVVTSAYAAIVALNQRVPDLVLIGRAVTQEQRTKIVTHLRSVSGPVQVHTLDIPPLTAPPPAERSGFQNPFRKKEAVAEIGNVASFAKQVGTLLAAAEDARATRSAAAPAEAAVETWDEVPLEAGEIVEPPAPPAVDAAPPIDPSHPAASHAESESDIRSADISLIEAEVEFRLKTEIERVQAEATQQQARELARVEAEAAEHRARELARVTAEAAVQRAHDLARIESEAASHRESAVIEARAAANAAAQASLAAEVERVRREAEQQLASEVARVRTEAEQALAARLGQTQVQAERERDDRLARAREEADAARAAAVEEAKRTADAAAARACEAEAEITRIKAEADVARATAIEETRLAAEAEAMRTRDAEVARVKAEADAVRAAAIEETRRAAEAEATRALEDEIARLKADTDAQVQAAVERARAESEAQLQAQVARAQAETEARLETQLAGVRGEAEQARHAHQQATLEADRIRIEAAEAARAGAEAALATETERIRVEANQRLESEVATLRAEAERQQALQMDAIRAEAPDAQPAGASFMARVPRVRWDLVRWDLVAAAAVIVLVAGAAFVWLPRVLSSAERTSSAWAGTASKAATRAASKAASAAVAAAPSVRNVLATRLPITRLPAASANVAPEQSEPAGPGFLAAFARIPMDLYADGRRIGSTEDGHLMLSSGSHQIEFVSARFHYRSTIALTIRPGETTSHTVALPSGRVRVTTTPGAEVWVEGERVGVAPMDAIPVPIGTREVVVKDPAFGERRESVEVKYGETAELTVMPAAAGPAAPARLAPLSQYQP